MTEPLQLLHLREVQLIAALPEGGHFEDRGPVIERAGLPEKWVQILHEFVELFENRQYRIEALRRAVFLVWYSWNEPWELSGVSSVGPELELRVLQALEVEMQAANPDRELCSMLQGYGEGVPFDRHPEFDSTLARLRGGAGLDPDLPFRGLESRGAMGAYWLTRNGRPRSD